MGVCNNVIDAMQPFFTFMHRALKPGGIICTQVRSRCSCLIMPHSEWKRRPSECLHLRQDGQILQGESLWLHLPIIKELASMCRSVFQGGDVKYAFTTIPTYPRLGCAFTTCLAVELPMTLQSPGQALCCAADK